MTDTKISALPELATPATGDVLPITHLGTTYKIQEQNLVPAQVNADWNAVSGVAQILNKPTLAQTMTNVLHKWLNSYNATTGLFTQTQPDYSDLTGVPSTFPIATPGTLTVSSTNSASGAHTHAITSSSAPGVAASILATDANGVVTLGAVTAAVGNAFGVSSLFVGAVSSNFQSALASTMTVSGVSANSLTGGIAAFKAILSASGFDSIGQVTNAYGAYISVEGGASTQRSVGTAYGLYVNGPAGAAYSTKYGIYQATASISNYFASPADFNAGLNIAGGTVYTLISSNPGAAAAILATDANGFVTTIQPGARAYNNAAISIPDSVLTALTFNSERWDTDNCHSTVSNTGRLTCNTAGKYIITGHIAFAQNAVGYRAAIIRLNGAGGTYIAAADQMAVTAADVTYFAITSTWNMAVNDYVELLVFQNSGGALNISAVQSYTPEFEMIRVAA